jgi:hypothetical protein
MTTVLFLILTSTSFAMNASFAQTKSFADWKTEKIQVAKTQLIKANAELAALLRVDVHSNLRPGLEAQIIQEQWNVEVAQDLSITDYLVLYLSTQRGSSKYKEAAAKLSADDTAKILEAYLKNMKVPETQDERRFPRHSSGDLDF